MINFNYQSKVWGATPIRLNLTFLGYLRLKYALYDLRNLALGSKVLEIGCGGGGFIGSIKNYRPDLECYGVDIGKSAVKKAKINFPSVKFDVGDIYKLRFKENFFDAIVIADVFEHLENPLESLKEVKRVLKKKGVFYAYIPLEGETLTLHNLFRKFGFDVKRKLAGHIQDFKLRDLRVMFKEAGFKIKDMRFEVFLLGQLMDLGFFTYLFLTGRRLSTGLEEDLKNKSFKRLFKNLIVTLVNIESIIFSRFKGAGVHITSFK